MPYPMIVQKLVQEGQANIPFNATVQVETVIKKNETIPTNTLDKEFLVGISVSALKCFALKCTAPMMVKTNSPSMPQETFNMAAGMMLIFVEGDAPIFAGDVTAFYVSNTSGSAGLFQVLAGTDA